MLEANLYMAFDADEPALSVNEKIYFDIIADTQQFRKRVADVIVSYVRKPPYEQENLLH